MPCWYFEKHELLNTPSFIRDSIDSDREARYRREGARFLMECGNQMGLRYDTMATGVVFFHRFYMFHSFNEFPRYVMATCCLFLAGKVEETPKKCKDIVKIAKNYLENKQLHKHSESFGSDPIKEIMTFERILLQTIKFDLQVDHPYGYLLKYAKSLKGNQEQIRTMVQMAWTFINDSYCTTLCLQWEPEIIAIALMYLTSKLSKLEITDWIDRKNEVGGIKQQHWWDQFVQDLGLDILEDICHQILDLYSTQQQQQQQMQQHHQNNSLTQKSPTDMYQQTTNCNQSNIINLSPSSSSSKQTKSLNDPSLTLSQPPPPSLPQSHSQLLISNHQHPNPYYSNNSNYGEHYQLPVNSSSSQHQQQNNFLFGSNNNNHPPNQVYANNPLTSMALSTYYNHPVTQSMAPVSQIISSSSQASIQSTITHQQPFFNHHQMMAPPPSPNLPPSTIYSSNHHNNQHPNNKQNTICSYNNQQQHHFFTNSSSNSNSFGTDFVSYSVQGSSQIQVQSMNHSNLITNIPNNSNVNNTKSSSSNSANNMRSSALKPVNITDRS